MLPPVFKWINPVNCTSVQQDLYECTEDLAPYKCKKCSFKAHSVARMKQHAVNGHKIRRESVKGQAYGCIKCDFETYSNLLMCRHNLIVKCVSRKERRDLEKSKLSEYYIKFDNTKKWQCEKCPTGFKLKEHLTPHYQFCHNELQQINKIHSTNFTKSWNLTNCFKCKICSLECRTKLKLKQHLVSQHSKAKVSVKCTICSWECTTELELKEHVLSQHSEPEDVKPFEFQVCKQEIDDDELYVAVTKSKKPKIYIRCRICLLTYRTKLKLKEHLCSQHSESKDNKLFDCEVCPLIFRNKSARAQHMIRRHVDDESNIFQCELCTWEFKTKTGLEKHIDSEHLYETKFKVFECKKCPFIFKNKEDLGVHMSFRHPRPRIWYQCTKCPERFTWAERMRKHLKTHDDVEEYS